MATIDPDRGDVAGGLDRSSFRAGGLAAELPTRPARASDGVDASRASRRARPRATAGLVVWDALIPVAVLGLMAHLQDGGPTLTRPDGFSDDKIAVLMAVMSPVALVAVGGYGHSSRRGDSRLFFGLRLLLVGVVLSWLSMTVAGLAGWPVDHVHLLAVAVAAPAGWLLGRAVCDHLPAVRSERVILVGSGDVAQRVVDLARRHRERRLTVVGRVEDDASGRPFDGVPLLGGIDDLQRLTRENDIDRVVVGFVPGRDATLVAALRTCIADGVDVDVVPRLFDLVGPSPRSRALGGMALVAAPGRGLSRGQRGAKRGFDITVAAGLSLMLAPVAIAIAVAIAVTDGRPILFRQTRSGRGGREFSILKFRTMRTDAETRGVALAAALADDTRMQTDPIAIAVVVRELKAASDRRVFPVGNFLRRSSLDELPQLVNVIRGDMSLIGPRPLRPFEVASLAPWQLARQDLRPGLTGLWQVLGRSDLDWDERMQLDYSYVSHWSFASDLRILARTVPAVLRKQGAV